VSSIRRHTGRTRLVLALAIVALALPLSALAVSTKGPTTVTYQFPYFGVTTDVKTVQTALNKRLAAQGIAVNLQPVPFAAWDEKMKLQFAAGGKCDVVFTAPWTNNYYQLVQNGSLLPLDGLLESVGAPTYKVLSPTTWNAARVNGKIYGVINQQIFVKQWGVNPRKDVAAKYGISEKTVKRFSDLTPIFARMKADGLTPIFADDKLDGQLYRDEQAGFDPILSADGIGYVDVGRADKKLRIFDPLRTQQFRRLAELAYQWKQAGYYDAEFKPHADAIAAAQNNRYGVFFHLAGIPGGGAKAGGNLGFSPGWTDGIAIGKPFLTTGGITATMNGICRSSEHPSESMKFLNALNTDPTAFRILSYGVEGKHYTFVNKKLGLIKIPESSPWNPNTAWMFGDTFKGYAIDKSDIGTGPKVAKINADAPGSVALGFVPNLDSIKNEIAQVSAARAQCVLPLTKGLVDPAKGIDNCIGQVNAAGEEKILSEIQSQINAWAKKG